MTYAVVRVALQAADHDVDNEMWETNGRSACKNRGRGVTQGGVYENHK